MKHKSLSLPEHIWKALKKYSKQDGISIGELVRRILGKWADGVK